jgi:hypothetical protein
VRVKCVAVRGSTIVAAGSDGEVRVSELTAAAREEGCSETLEPRLAAQASTGARITSCAIAATH